MAQKHRSGRFILRIVDRFVKRFDCLPHELLAAEFSAYGFDISSTKFLLNYLTDWKYRTKKVHAYSSWENITSDVPQGLILGPLLFNIDSCDLFFVSKNYDIVNYADDNKHYVTGETIESVIGSLEKVSVAVFEMFYCDKQMQVMLINTMSY